MCVCMCVETVRGTCQDRCVGMCDSAVSCVNMTRSEASKWL